MITTMKLKLEGPGKSAVAAEVLETRFFDNREIVLVRHKGKHFLVRTYFALSPREGGHDIALFYIADAPRIEGLPPPERKRFCIPSDFEQIKGLKWSSLQTAEPLSLSEVDAGIYSDMEVDATRRSIRENTTFGEELAALKKQRVPAPRHRVPGPGTSPKTVRSILSGEAGFSRGV